VFCGESVMNLAWGTKDVVVIWDIGVGILAPGARGGKCSGVLRLRERTEERAVASPWRPAMTDCQNLLSTLQKSSFFSERTQ
jgi:hypothetical protein